MTTPASGQAWRVWMMVLLVVIAVASVVQAADSIQRMQDRSVVRDAIRDASEYASYRECMDADDSTLAQCESMPDAPTA